MNEAFLLRIILIACGAAFIALAMLTALFVHIWRCDPASGKPVAFWEAKHDAIHEKLDRILSVLVKEPR